jgi:hypothetical protein
MENKIGILSQEEYKNQFRVNNAAAFATPANYGLEQTLSTLTQIVAGVQRQKFYTIDGALTDYIPMEMGTGAYGQQLFQYAVAQVGDSFESGIIQPGNGINKDANLDIVVDSISIKNNFWRMKYQATKELVEMARANAVNFSYIEEQERARLKTYQLGIQKATFLGISGLTEGLLNLSGVTVNTSLMPADFANMTTAQLNNFAATAAATFFSNSNSTSFPNTLLVPTQDLGGLATFISSSYPIGETRKEFLERAFKAAGAPQDFKILHTAYGKTAGTGGTARYVLYNRDADVLKMYLPKPYTPYPLYPTGSLDMVSDAEAQFTGVWAKRPKEILYMDVTAL